MDSRNVQPSNGSNASPFTVHERRDREQMERALLAAARSIPRDPAPTPQQGVDLMCRSFDGEAEPTLRATLQLDVTGRGGGRWHLRIDRGRCDSGHGDAQRPDLVVRARVQEFVRLGLGQVTPFWSAAKGTLAVTGRMRLGDALRMLSLFKPAYRWPDP